MSLSTGNCIDEMLPNMDDWEWSVDGKQPERMASIARPQVH